MRTHERASTQKKSEGPGGGRESHDTAMDMMEHLGTFFGAVVGALVIDGFSEMLYGGWTLETAVGLTQIQLLGQDGSIPDMLITYPETAGYWAFRGAYAFAIGVAALTLLKMISLAFSEAREAAKLISKQTSSKRAYGN